MRPSLAQWLAARVAAPPSELDERLARVAERYPGGDPARECVRAALDLLQRCLAPGLERKEQALDLLAADAFLTYAFEAAAAEEIPQVAVTALRGLVALADTLASESRA